MVKPLDSATQAAIADRSAIAVRNLVWFTVKDGNGDPVDFGFTDFGLDISVPVIDGITGSEVTRTFRGDEGPLLSVGPMPRKIGLEVNTVAVELNPFHPFVETMYRGHDCRNAPVQLYRGFLSIDSGLFVAPPRIRFLGFVNRAPKQIGAVGAQGTLKFAIVSVTRKLTRVNPAKWSDETQRRRSGDRFLRYVGTAHKREIHWGEKAPKR